MRLDHFMLLSIALPRVSRTLDTLVGASRTLRLVRVMLRSCFFYAAVVGGTKYPVHLLCECYVHELGCPPRSPPVLVTTG